MPREAVKPDVGPELEMGRWLPGRGLRKPPERGGRRTRQDQISVGIVAGEIAEPSGSRTERRNLCFFCRTGFGKVALSEIRSSRLT
ncbi:hypothetical protein chiPu_0029294 [Chiloscyllium punctatum]|uniref:Uncharacterized protein n=1 Tax=Chiloscyllium punctatum TaxID=137246 RepID=A0A401TRL4_CHIPU|nr:hypothetical protein [Chiloscyllium punctatum]